MIQDCLHVTHNYFINFIEWLFTPCEWSTLRVYLFTRICYHNTLFTFEYFFLQIRLACAPRKIQFFVAPMNLVDLFAIVPFFLDLIIGGLQVGLLQDQAAILLSLNTKICALKYQKCLCFLSWIHKFWKRPNGQKTLYLLSKKQRFKYQL